MDKVLLGVALLMGAFNYALAIDGAAPQGDGKEYYCAGMNLYLFGVVSQHCAEGEQPSDAAPPPTMEREPGVPMLIALTFALTGGEGDVRACVTASSDGCNTLRTHQRMIFLVLFLALILLVYLAGRDVMGSANLAGAAALCAAFGNGLIEGSMAFLTEPTAPILLLIVAWMLYRLTRGRRLVASGAIFLRSRYQS